MPQSAPKLRNLPPRLAVADHRIARVEPKRVDGFYTSPEWRGLIADIVALRGRRCEDPEHDAARPRSGMRVYGDHIRALSDGGAPLDQSNVLLRCGSCHTRKTVAERSARMARPS